jgi:hypothetical protein
VLYGFRLGLPLNLDAKIDNINKFLYIGTTMSNILTIIKINYITGTIVKNIQITNLLSVGLYEQLLINKNLNSLYIGGFLT